MGNNVIRTDNNWYYLLETCTLNKHLRNEKIKTNKRCDPQCIIYGCAGSSHGKQEPLNVHWCTLFQALTTAAVSCGIVIGLCCVTSRPILSHRCSIGFRFGVRAGHDGVMCKKSMCHIGSVWTGIILLEYHQIAGTLVADHHGAEAWIVMHWKRWHFPTASIPSTCDAEPSWVVLACDVA